jgi:hypothetical protein
LIEDAADAQKVRTTDSPVQQWKEGRKKRGGREEGREGGREGGSGKGQRGGGGGDAA